MLDLVKDPVEPVAGGTVDFVMLGCADVVAAAATAAVASVAAPRNK